MIRVVIYDAYLPQWLRTSFVDDDGRVFLPCGAFGDEAAALLCLGYDGEPLIRDGKHVYARAVWLANENPQLAETIDKIVARIRMEVGIAISESRQDGEAAAIGTSRARAS